MASIAKLITGAQDSWGTTLMTTELNSLASGSAVLGGTSIANGTNNDLFVEFSFTTGGSITPSGTGAYLGLYMYPLNQDGTTYGDGRFGSATAAIPPGNYYVGFMGLVLSAGTQVGSFSSPFSKFQFALPRGTWKPVLYSLAGVALSSSGNILAYRTTNTNLNG